MIKRSSTAVWNGTGAKGTGSLSTLSGALTEQPYTSDARFVSEDGKAGTNPEELIGAAHAGCFTLSLAYALSRAGHEKIELRTTAVVSMEKQDIGWTIIEIALATEGTVPGVDAATFTELAAKAKAGCPISRALASVPITITSKLL